MTSSGPILFFDGHCGLCTRTVRWCLRHDHRGRLRYAPLQGPTYQALDVTDKPTDVSTLVLLEDGRLFVRGDGMLRVMHLLGGIWRILAAVGKLLPRAARDAIYNFIARHRLAWFGPADHCDRPEARHGDRFLP